MKNQNEQAIKEKKILTSKTFTKYYVKLTIVNIIIFLILSALGIESIFKILPSPFSIIAYYVAVALLFTLSVKETFNIGKIVQADIPKVAKNILITWGIILLVEFIATLLPVTLNQMQLSQFFKKEVTLEMILNGLFPTFLYTILFRVIIAIISRIRFLKMCKNPENVA